LSQVQLRHQYADAIWPPPKPYRGDVVAAVSVATILVPQAMAYADVAGLPPSVGLLAAAVAPIAAAMFASSPYLQTGPVALTARGGAADASRSVLVWFGSRSRGFAAAPAVRVSRGGAVADRPGRAGQDRFHERVGSQEHRRRCDTGGSDRRSHWRAQPCKKDPSPCVGQDAREFGL